MNVFRRHKIKSPYVTAFINTSVPTENDKIPLTSGSEYREEPRAAWSGVSSFFVGGGGT